MDELVQRLSEGDHRIVAGRAANAAELKASIDRGYVLLKFTETRGGTELGVRLDTSASDCSRANFGEAGGTVHLVGSLTLNYVRVRCVADLDVATREGVGHLEVLDVEEGR